MNVIVATTIRIDADVHLAGPGLPAPRLVGRRRDGVRLDVDAAEAAVRKLENVQQEIEAARRAAVDVARTTPTARDAVSLEAFALLAQKADDGPGSFTAAVDAARRNRFLPIFEPLEIAGLPAVDIMSGPQVQTCTTSVGTADGQSLDLDSSVGGGLDGIRDGDPCAEGHRVAEEIISTLPPR